MVVLEAATIAMEAGVAPGVDAEAHVEVAEVTVAAVVVDLVTEVVLQYPGEGKILSLPLSQSLSLALSGTTATTTSVLLTQRSVRSRCTKYLSLCFLYYPRNLKKSKNTLLITATSQETLSSNSQ